MQVEEPMMLKISEGNKGESAKRVILHIYIYIYIYIYMVNKTLIRRIYPTKFMNSFQFHFLYPWTSDKQTKIIWHKKLEWFKAFAI
jgi:hypothetical protein